MIAKFLIGIIFVSLVSSEVSLYNLEAFFDNTYDTNHDGYATITQFVKYFQFMEPQHDITQQSTQDIFDYFDFDSDKKVTLEELVRMAKIKIGARTGHKQIHLGLTQRPYEMQVMWVSTPEKYTHPIVYYGEYPTTITERSADAIISTYNVGKIGFHGSIYRAVMKDIVPGKRYYYKVGDKRTNTYSTIKHFKGPYPVGYEPQQVNFAVFGDMGTFAPFGHVVINKIVENNWAKPFDLVFLTGDIAYAGMNNEKVGETEPIWDLFGELTQKFAAYVPFMPGVGNHQKYYNYTSYFSRYVLPRAYPDQTNLWFSFDYGKVHFAHFSSEHPYTKGSEQYAFLEQDLRKARDNPNINWIILGVHRAFYCSDKDQYSPITPLANALEDLVNQFKVDIVQTGHLHAYQRTWPVFKGKAYKDGHNQTHYNSPNHPIYIVQGTAGALIRQLWINPRPEWSLKRTERYGYGRMRIKGKTLKYQFIGAPSGNIIDEWTITK